ncbi:ABC transporter substrate-binding protein [Rhodococcus sp. 05-2254-6]|uniref:ABC transporter substrate-binding protein n=1 Tax=Rhodococcus sp. 05-2254-6 TaxID=2022489 RepID=UPI00211B0FCD|nr:ABC transporter substrate-binding protein [Rhodococcus sp. 05-2254-6]
MRISRSLALPAAVLALALTLSACSSDAGDGDSADSSQAGGVVVTDMFGDVEVPANPQRVVALGWSDAETALALGVQPVGASDWLGVGGNGLGPWVDESYDTDPTIVGTFDVNMESVAALEPDLILWTRSTNDKAVYDDLSDIAPTVAAPPGTDVAYGTTWDGQTEIVAQALGKVDQGKQLVDDTRALFDNTIAANPEFADKTVAVGTLYSGQVGVTEDHEASVPCRRKALDRRVVGDHLGSGADGEHDGEVGVECGDVLLGQFDAERSGFGAVLDGRSVGQAE